MAKRHDEGKDLRLISRVCKLDYAEHRISANKAAIIGNKTWGRIDFLTHYCGWHFVWDNTLYITKKVEEKEEQSNKKESKAQAKATVVAKAKKASRENKATKVNKLKTKK